MNAKFKKGMLFVTAVCMLGTILTGSALADEAVKRERAKTKIQLQKIELTEEQKTEMKAKFEAKLKEEVANGKITQEKADEMLANFGKGKMPMMSRQAPKMGKMSPKGGQMSELTEEQKAEMKAKFEEKLKQEVANGKITQEKADEMLANLGEGKMPMMGRQAPKMGKMSPKGRQMPELTEEQKAEMKAKSEDFKGQRPQKQQRKAFDKTVEGNS